MTTGPTAVPRPEYPRPQLVRERWLNLNGPWQFEVDRGDSGLERGLVGRPLSGSILVPFAPESSASGVGDVDFLRAVWYRREVTVPSEWGDSDILLHFGAVDHDATVWVNGVEVARHRGGFTSFTADLRGVASAGDAIDIVVRARDDPSGPQARGKQSVAFQNSGCTYTRTTGIWQTVWMEPVPRIRARRLRIVPDAANAAFTVVAVLTGAAGSVLAVLRDSDGVVASRRVDARADLAPTVRLDIPTDRVRLWSPEDPHLYRLTVEVVGREGVADTIESYAGLRSVAIDGHRVLLNGRPVFQRLVLDQGLWPDTLMTAPTDDALRSDIELAMAAGFNGARLHQKVFEERYFYHADRMGYLVWSEFGDWGASGFGPRDDHQHPTPSFVTQWLEALDRDVSHPAIIGWCPLNETHQPVTDRITVLDDVTHAMYLATKLADPTRPVLDVSGYSHRVRTADVFDSHSYEQDPRRFAAEMEGLAQGDPHVNRIDGEVVSIPFAGQPYFVSEFGGIWWNAELASAAEEPLTDGTAPTGSWGYGQRVRSSDEWHERFSGLTGVLLGDALMFGYCYTQLTDTFQEENGIYDSRRRPKLDIARIAAAQRRPAAFESPRRHPPA